MEQTHDSIPDKPLLWVLTAIAAITGGSAIVLPFTYDTSPADVLSPAEIVSNAGLLMLACPFLLPIPILVAYSRCLVRGRLSRPERIVALVLGLGSGAVTLILAGGGLVFAPTADGWEELLHALLIALSTLAVLGIGVALGIRGRRRGLPPSRSAVLSMQVAYLANGCLCTFVFMEDWEIGAYAFMATALVYAVQISVLFFRPAVESRQGVEDVTVAGLEQRIAKLEKQGYYLKLAGSTALLIVGFAFLVEDIPTKDIITTRQLVVVDNEGIPRARLQASSAGAGLYFAGTKPPRLSRLELSMYWDQPQLVMESPDSWFPRATLMVGEYGPSLFFRDEQGRVRALYGVNRLPSDIWGNRTPEEDRDESSIQLFDAECEVVTQLP